MDWSDVSITLNNNEINLPRLVIIPFTERYRARKLLKKHLGCFRNGLVRRQYNTKQ